GVGRRFEPRGEAGGVRVFDDYGHNPTKVAATLEAARAVADGGRVLVLFQPHLYSRTRHTAAELADALTGADVVAVSEVYAAREAPQPGIGGKLVVDALASERPGMPVAWTPQLEDGPRLLARRAPPGCPVLTGGRGRLHRARAAGLGGFEFACAIPGTVGGGVWMNAGAYGSDWAAILERALVVDGHGAHWLGPEELGLTYRRSALRHGQVVARAEFRLEPRPEQEIKAKVSELQALRKAAQPTNKRTFGSVFKNPEHELSAGRILEACGLRGHQIGGAQISLRHANFIENAGEARSADAIALMAEARRRALEQFGVELEHEV